MTQKQFDIDTLLAQAGNRDNNDQYHSVSTPIYLTSNFRHRDLEDAETFDPHQQYSYSRLSTPTRSVLQKRWQNLKAAPMPLRSVQEWQRFNWCSRFLTLAMKS